MAWFKKAPATCATCPFAAPLETPTSFACRFFPPTPIVAGDNIHTVNVNVAGDHWCGQHPGRRV